MIQVDFYTNRGYVKVRIIIESHS